MKNTLLLSVLMFSAFSSSAAMAEENVEKELANYWTTERELPVLENRMFEREGRFALTLKLGLLTSEPFFWYNPIGLGAQYHFSEQASLEVSGTFMGTPSSDGDIGLQIFTHKTEITDFIKRERKDAFDVTTDLEDRFLWRANAVLIWSPLYGKLAFLNTKLSHFDLNLALGAGVVQVDRPSVDHKSSSTEFSPELVFGGGVGFFVTKDVTIRLDGRFYMYPGAESESASGFFERLKVPSEFSLGASYLF